MFQTSESERVTGQNGPHALITRRARGLGLVETPEDGRAAVRSRFLQCSPILTCVNQPTSVCAKYVAISVQIPFELALAGGNAHPRL